jgi:spermidine/putrescine transport system substrate-binding protein
MKTSWIRFAKTSLGLLAVSVCTLATAAEQQKLNLFIWSEYIDPAMVTDFEKQFDCKVNIDLYEDNEAMLAKVQGGGAGMYDLVVPSDNIVPAMTKQKLLAPLRHENIPNIKNLEEKFINPAYDRSNKFTVAYQWGTVGILVRKAEGKPLPDSWDVFFDPKKQAGSFMLIDSVRDMVGPALKYKGYSVNSIDPKQLKEARDLIIESKKRSVGFDGSVGVKNKILGKTAQMGIVYSGEGVRAVGEDKEVAYVIPKEGSIIWVDNIAVLAKAPHRDLAEKFINFILDPKQGARLSTFTQFSTPNKAAKANMKPEDLANLAVYPPAETVARLEFLEDLGSKTRLYDEVWTQIKAK